MRALRLWFLWLAAPLLLACGADEVADLAKAVASELEEDEMDELDEALYEGFVQGVALNFDYVSLGKHSSSDEERTSEPNKEITEEDKPKIHEKNLERAELEADYLTRHRPLESTQVDETESDVYSLLNILMHYFNTRAQPWKLVEPKSVGLEDGLEHHMVFISEASDAENRHIPRNMILSVGNIAKTLPQKRGKTPILLTCLETFIVSKLAYSLMSRLVDSPAPVDTKLKYIYRWIHLAQNHFVLYLPYVTITAQRCVDVLAADGKLKPEFEDTHYQNLLNNCSAMVKKRDQEADLQTFVMLDAELHRALIETCIRQRHIIPSLLEEKETHLKRIHEVLDREMSWETFSNAVNMVFADLERNILKADDYLMKPDTWGCGLEKQAAETAEKQLIAAFAKTHLQLNLKVRSTIIELNRVIADAAPDKGAALADALLKFVEREYHAALEEAHNNQELSQCMTDAKHRFAEEARKYDDNMTTASYTAGIAVDMKKYVNEGWMPCMSARILGTVSDTCAEKPQYCRMLLDVLRESIGSLEPDSTSALVMENFHNVVSVAMLKNKTITPEDLRSYLAKVARNELKQISALNGGGAASQAPPPAPTESEGDQKGSDQKGSDQASSDQGEPGETSESSGNEVQSETTDQAIKEH
ncbi:atypical ABC1 ABC1-C kinase, putative [Babesia caballi]|uniref:Atypical ABC1 ABC1-C kinase, putative n=1 Tax=Babesia caballi TaxID=5871 RepID=A0AAV4LPP9_BABCB|nr:atypical ABC1 ABC1-C kinase, putative [Babesia caballi]